jgi:hypothetical protein
MTAEEDVKKLLSCMQDPMTIVNMRRIFLLMMRVHWSDSAHFGFFEEFLECDTYNYENPNEGLTVDLRETFNPENTDRFPGVFVGFYNGFTFEKKAIDDFHSRSDDRARTHRVKRSTGRLVVSHIHTSADIALSMAEIDAEFLFGIREALFNYLPIKGFDVTNIGEPVKVGESPQRFYRVEVVAELTADFAVTTNIESHRIKKIAATLNPASQ